MSRGHHHWWNGEPKWAWAIIIAGTLFMGIGIPLTSGRGDVSAAEARRLTAENEAAESASSAPPPPLPVERPSDRPLRVLFAGDSITVGAFSMTPDANFRNLVTTALSQGGTVDPVRIGDSGLTTAEVFPDIASAAPTFDVLIVELGTNDVHKTDVGQFGTDYRAFLDAIRAKSPDAALVCTGPWEDRTLAKVGQMQATAEKECTGHGGRFVDVLPLYADANNRGPEGTVRPLDGQVLDDFHPNNAGHAAIAAAILGQLAY